MKILLIDDHVLFRDGLKLVLEGLNGLEAPIETIDAGSFESAIIAIQEEDDFDIILLDLGLPGINDIDALAAIRQKLPSTPIVVLSANEDAQKVAQVFQHGAQGYITKSSSAKIILNALQLVLAGGVYIPAEILASRQQHSENSVTAPAKKSPGTITSNKPANITPRQSDVLFELATGKTNREIAQALSLTESTVRVHVAAILKAFDVSNRTQAVQHAMKNGLIPPPTLNT